MIQRHAEYFREWLAVFPEGLFVILRVYADESGTNDQTGKLGGSEAPTLCGFIESPDYWARFCPQWQSILDRHSAPYFHFREFVDKSDRYKIKDNPYLDWNEDRRENFLYDLAIVASGAVLFGGCYSAKKHHALGKTENPYRGTIEQFYKHLCERLDSHWPGFDGQVLFVFDEQQDVCNWIIPLTEIHQSWQARDGRIGGRAFEDDKRCPPLQAADLLVFCMRQQAERFMESGERQPKRILDFILGKNSNPANRNFPPAQWEKMVRFILNHQKQQKADWAKERQKRTYYPEQHFPFEKYGFKYEQR